MAKDSVDWLDIENQRIAARREALKVVPPSIGKDREGGAWGLALSGGGIRSATFSLGLMQALAQAKIDTGAARPPESDRGDEEKKDETWLRCFDYLSTVSGGGYIGAFFISLFVPGRLRGKREMGGSLRNYAATMFANLRARFTRGDSETPEGLKQSDPGVAAAEDAYRVLRDDPPGRVRSREKYDPFRRPLAWLRENGRYLTPTGAGDFLYAIGFAIRNWCSLHYVVGTVLLLLYTLIFVVKVKVARLLLSLPQVPDISGVYDKFAIRPGADFFGLSLWSVPDATTWSLWWSPLWVLPAAVIVLWLVPSGLAYWQTWRGEADPGPPGWLGRFWRISTLATWFDVGIVIALYELARVLYGDGGTRLGVAAGALAAVIAIGVAFHVIGSLASDGAESQRVAQTRWLATGLQALIVLVVVAVLDTLAQTFYLWLTSPGSVIDKLLTSTGAFGVAVWLLRKVPVGLGGKDTPSWLAKVPLDVIAGVAALVMLLVVASAWAVLAQWVIWSGGAPQTVTGTGLAAEYGKAGWLALAAAGLCWINGRFPGFINLSTLQAFYSARLTRAYLGASNGARFKDDEKGGDKEREQEYDDERRRCKPGRKWNSAAEPHPGDPIARADYYGKDVLAPVHLINVTMDQTVDPAEQLVQRDRKGKPLAIGPAGYLLDGRFKRYNTKTDDYSIGEWIGVSGAAFTTGLGRATSLGLSLLLGLVNVRLGTWWGSTFGCDGDGWVEKSFLKVFPTQMYLAYEFASRFHGDHRPRQYLSDGGHFENTAAYELLRRERDVSVIVASDNGCDGEYHFADLANLIRLARIDHGARFELVSDYDRADTKRIVLDKGKGPSRKLSDVFGKHEDFDRNADKDGDDKTDVCAMLYYVSYPDIDGMPEGRPRWLIVVKPRLVASAPLDVWQYHKEHQTFPQETTTDQFFDEAQWESYRKLGLVIGTRIFRDYGAQLIEAMHNYKPHTVP